MSRPMKGKEPLDVRITIRVTQSSLSRLKEVALASGLDIGEIVRRRIDGVKIPNRGNIKLAYSVRLLHQELARQGGLIKQLYNMNPFEPELTRKAWNAQIENSRKADELLELIKERIESNDSKDGGTA